MDNENNYTIEDADEIFNTPEKLREHIDRLKTERDRLVREVSHLHRTLLYIVRNTDALNGGTQ